MHPICEECWEREHRPGRSLERDPFFKVKQDQEQGCAFCGAPTRWKLTLHYRWFENPRLAFLLPGLVVLGFVAFGLLVSVFGFWRH
jgi:hypothetical protein